MVHGMDKSKRNLNKNHQPNLITPSGQLNHNNIATCLRQIMGNSRHGSWHGKIRNQLK
jgi:hypothetical protein